MWLCSAGEIGFRPTAGWWRTRERNFLQAAYTLNRPTLKQMHPSCMWWCYIYWTILCSCGECKVISSTFCRKYDKETFSKVFLYVRWETEGQSQVPESISTAVRSVLINLNWMMRFGSVPFQHCLAEQLSISWVQKPKDKTDMFSCPSCLCQYLMSRWPVLSARQPQAYIDPVRRPAPPHAEPPCDPRPRWATGRSSPYCRTCDRRCEWPAPGGWQKGGERWPWGGRKGLMG